jgi:hemerythrin
MAIITWDVRLETRHSQIDGQHKALIQAFNDLHHAMKQGKGMDEVGKTLGDGDGRCLGRAGTACFSFGCR